MQRLGFFLTITVFMLITAPHFFGFIDGLQVLWGWSAWITVPLWAVLLLGSFVISPLLRAPIMIGAFFGAHLAWGWTWWGAALFAAFGMVAGMAVTLLGVLLGAVIGMLEHRALRR